MKIRSSVKTLEIEDLKGKKKVYSFETGDPEILELWLSKAEEIKGLAESNDDGQEMKVLYQLERDFITMVLGVKSWKQIKKDCNNSVFSLFPVFAEVSKLITDSIEENGRLMGAIKK